MDEQLAAIYGTNQVIEEEDQEKLAAAELLVKLAEEEGVDINSLNDEEINELMSELYTGSESTTVVPDDSQEKVAEADFLGRVMAHAYVQEMGEIEKNAGKAGEALKAVGRWFKGRPAQYREAGREMKEVFTGKGHLGTGAMTKKDRLRSLLSAAKRTAPEAAVAGGGATGAIAAHKYSKSHK